MNNIFENKNIVKAFKEISLAEFEVYVNNYMKKNLEVGNKYHFRNIHSIINENVLKGFGELLSGYGIDYAIIYETLSFGIWRLTLKLDKDLISIWEDIGSYNFDTKIRKNASSGNDSFTLMSIPRFRLYETEKNMSLYDLIIKMFEKKKENMITMYSKQIEDYKRNITDTEDMLEKVKNIII